MNLMARECNITRPWNIFVSLIGKVGKLYMLVSGRGASCISLYLMYVIMYVQ